MVVLGRSTSVVEGSGGGIYLDDGELFRPNWEVQKRLVSCTVLWRSTKNLFGDNNEVASPRFCKTILVAILVVVIIPIAIAITIAISSIPLILVLKGTLIIKPPGPNPKFSEYIFKRSQYIL